MDVYDLKIKELLDSFIDYFGNYQTEVELKKIYYNVVGVINESLKFQKNLAIEQLKKRLSQQIHLSNKMNYLKQKHMFCKKREDKLIKYYERKFKMNNTVIKF